MDGILLALHGAMYTEKFPQADEEIVRRVRKAFGNDIPFVLTHDFHGNVSPEIVEMTNVLVSYQQCPHLDMRQRGVHAALLMGGLIGARLVYRAKVWVVQGLVGFAPILAATFYTLSNLGLMPIGGTGASLPPGLTMIAIAASFVFGILLNFGVGSFAPTLALFSVMGLDPRYCFSIMASSNGLAGAIVASRHVLARKIDLRIVLGIALGGIPAVLIAAFLVKSMPIETLRWLVTLVVLYTAVVMLRSAAAGQRNSETTAPTFVADGAKIGL